MHFEHNQFEFTISQVNTVQVQVNKAEVLKIYNYWNFKFHSKNISNTNAVKLEVELKTFSVSHSENFLTVTEHARICWFIKQIHAEELHCLITGNKDEI